MKDALEIQILILNHRQDDAREIQIHLENHMRLPWKLMHCVNIKEALSRVHRADIILLELELDGSSSPHQIFQDIGDKAFEIPIVVLINSKEKKDDLVTYVMEKGAADIIVRGQFERLVDAIEFALIRQKIATDTRKKNDLKQKSYQEKNTEFSIALELNEAQMEKNRQILRMFMGDYSNDERNPRIQKPTVSTTQKEKHEKF